MAAYVKLHTVFITYNRLELTKRAIESYLETVDAHYSFAVADNGSSDGTWEWLRGFYDSCEGFSLLGDGSNHYPGWAANSGWSLAPEDSTHLHRADNDFIFLPGWCEEVERGFSGRKKLGQLGLRTHEEENYETWNVGGNCVIRRELWDAGLRWDERPWPELREAIGPGHTEDSLMSPAVKKMGWNWSRVKRPCIQPIGFESPDDDYYKSTWADRGIVVP